jgi:hypothetical protein
MPEELGALVDVVRAGEEDCSIRWDGRQRSLYIPRVNSKAADIAVTVQTVNLPDRQSLLSD